MSLQRIAWLITVLGFLVSSVVLLASDYTGYALVAVAVAASAAVNLR